jgi:hypothetical protein
MPLDERLKSRFRLSFDVLLKQFSIGHRQPICPGAERGYVYGKVHGTIGS